MHVITATFGDVRTERIRCLCAGCELWRTVDFREMYELYERAVERTIVGNGTGEWRGVFNEPGIEIHWPGDESTP